MWFKKKNEEQTQKVDYFNTAWLSTWVQNLSEDNRYRKAGSKWNAPLLLKFQPIPEILTLNHSNLDFLNKASN